ncbi:MAG: hypothetical protein VKK62_00630 [Synechococcaceae cyanobacterium]|nr:hypothetical protein [Synechococcaceae cyanobacterium]
MSLDPRSRERLAALGRTLPQKLPSPAAPSAPDPLPAEAGARLHRVETEQDPDALFHELMRASSDGTVPPHLLERLRELEQRRPASASPQAAAVMSVNGGPTTTPQRRSQPARGATPPRRRGTDPEQQALYSAFQELLLDEDP